MRNNVCHSFAVFITNALSVEFLGVNLCNFTDDDKINVCFLLDKCDCWIEWLVPMVRSSLLEEPFKFFPIQCVCIGFFFL